MTITAEEYIDITGSNANRARIVPGGARAFYATGLYGVQETPAEVLAALNGGMTVLMLDQTPGLLPFGNDSAYTGVHVRIADVERYAGTPETFEAAVVKRQAKGLFSTCYCSYSAMGSVMAAWPSTIDRSLIRWSVADYSWSYAQAIGLLNENPTWGSIQFGDPMSNPNTLVPGTTDETLQSVQGDINVCSTAWLKEAIEQQLPTVPPPPVPPTSDLPPARRNIYTPVTVDGLFGPLTTRAEQFVSFGGSTAMCDGYFGILSRRSMQRHLNVTDDGAIGPITVEALQRRVGATIDGVWGKQTTLKLQEALNAGTY